jgi:hypothetical protein
MVYQKAQLALKARHKVARGKRLGAPPLEQAIKDLRPERAQESHKDSCSSLS